MTCQLSFARLGATVVQGFMQGLKRGFLRLCNTCKGHGNSKPHACRRTGASARMCESYTKGLQVLQPLHFLKENGGFPPFHARIMCKGAQGYAHFLQGLVL